MTTAVVDLGSPGHDTEYGWGRIRIAAALELLEELHYDCRSDLTLGDIANTWGYGVANGAVDSADLNYYVAQFGLVNVAVCDMTTSGTVFGQPGYGHPDGVLDGDDLIYYLTIHSAGCP